MEPILSVENLSVSFQRYGRGLSRTEVHAIRGLSLEAEAGQVTAVVGESGSGKSLLAHAILHILPSNASVSGQIRYAGDPLTPQRAQALRGREIALIPQGVTYLDPLMRVGPQVLRGRTDPETRSRCRQVLARYGLGPEVEELYPFELSGGMARRVLIACAVMEQPRLIVADEPTPGLDAKTARRILGHLRELAQEGAGVLLITHDLELALSVSDKLAVFQEGRAVDQLSPADLQTGAGPRHPFTQALWRAMPSHEFL